MVAKESIVASHSLIPGALEHIFAGYAAMLDPKLPLSRRDHELIAATVSGLPTTGAVWVRLYTRLPGLGWTHVDYRYNP
jgi:hypothetical protein